MFLESSGHNKNQEPPMAMCPQQLHFSIVNNNLCKSERIHTEVIASYILLRYNLN